MDDASEAGEKQTCTAVTAVKMAPVLVFSSGLLRGSQASQGAQQGAGRQGHQAIRDHGGPPAALAGRGRPSLQKQGRNPEEDQAPPPAGGQLGKERRRR